MQHSRSCTFLDRLELKFTGKVLPGAICLGDFYDDGENQLAVGNASGTVAIFKGMKRTPWAVAYRLGTITCCAEGLVMGRNRTLVVVTSEGWLHLFHLDQRHQSSASDRQRSMAAFYTSGSGEPSLAEFYSTRASESRKHRGESMVIQPTHTVRVPLNVCSLLVPSGNRDMCGQREVSSWDNAIILGSSDGTVYAVRVSKNSAESAATQSDILEAVVTCEWTLQFPIQCLFFRGDEELWCVAISSSEPEPFHGWGWCKLC
jgi:hypothetical protein